MNRKPFSMTSCTVTPMKTAFNANIAKALDQVAPIKTFKIRSNHRFGLSDSTTELMRKRDKTRGSISKAKGQQKGVLLQQYKILRNQVTSKIHFLVGVRGVRLNLFQISNFKFGI